MKKRSLMLIHDSTQLTPERLEREREKIIALCVRSAPAIVQALTDEALKGNVHAARLVLQVAGLIRTGAMVATQVNLSTPFAIPEHEFEELKKDLLAHLQARPCDEEEE